MTRGQGRPFTPSILYIAALTFFKRESLNGYLYKQYHLGLHGEGKKDLQTNEYNIF